MPALFEGILQHIIQCIQLCDKEKLHNMINGYGKYMSKVGYPLSLSSYDAKIKQHWVYYTILWVFSW